MSATSANDSTVDTLSFTAFIVVRSLCALSRTSRWRALVSKETARYAEHCVRYAASHSTLCQLVGKMPDAIYLWLMDHCNAYGMALHFTLRKRLIETTAHEAIRKGVSQIIVLGAGFDSLALRLHRQYPNIFFVEMDQRATQAAKREAIVENTTSNLVFVPCDLSMRGALREHLIHHSKFSLSRTTLFILEGLCMYLTENENKELFSEIHALCPAGSQIIFGALAVSKTQAGWIARLLLRFRKESYHWVISTEEMTGWIAENNFRLIKTSPYLDLQQTYRTKNEIRKLTRKSFENYYLVEANSGCYWRQS